MSATDADLPLMDFSLVFEDDHARYRHYRRLSPVCRTPFGSYVALRHRHGAIATHPELTRQMELESMAIQGIASGPIYDFYEAGMLFANGEAHRRRRAPVSRAFAFKLVEGMRAGIAELAAGIVRSRLGEGPFDFLYDVAGEIPARVIAEILGAPDGHRKVPRLGLRRDARDRHPRSRLAAPDRGGRDGARLLCRASLRDPPRRAA